MSDKVTLATLTTFTNDTSAVTQTNANNALITTAFDNTLSLDGTQPNQMGADLDMNGNRILNLPTPGSATEPVRFIDLTPPVPTLPINVQAVVGVTRAQIPSTVFQGTNTIILSGNTTAGDAGAGAVYTSVGATSGGLRAIQDAHSNWWNLVPQGSPGPSFAPTGFSGYCHVGWFGAACDQSTNDTAAVQAAVTWAVNNQGTVKLKNNFITATINCGTASTTRLFFNIIGDGLTQSLIANNLNAPYLLLDVGSAGAIQDVTFQDLHIVNTGNNTNLGIGIEFRGSGTNTNITNWLINNVVIGNMNTAFLCSNPFGLNWGQMSNFRVFNCTNGINLQHSGGTGNNWSDIIIQLGTIAGTGINCGDGTQNMGDQNWNNIQIGGGVVGQKGMIITGGVSYGDYNIVNGFHADGCNPALQLTNVHHCHVYGNFTNAPITVDSTSTDVDINYNDTNAVTIATSQNNYALPSGTPTSYLNVTASAGSLSITGIAGGWDGRLLTIVNVGATAFSLTDESVSSLAQNRFELAGSSPTLNFGQSIALKYSVFLGRWLRVGGQ